MARYCLLNFNIHSAHQCGCGKRFHDVSKLKDHIRTDHQDAVWLGHKTILVEREDGTFLCPECPRSYTYPPALQKHYKDKHDISDDPPSSPTKRPRGSLSPQQSKKRVRTQHEPSVVEETEDEDMEKEGEEDDEEDDDDDDETVQGLEQGMKRLATKEPTLHAADLIRPDDFAQAQLAIEPDWCITICEACGYAVPRSHIHSHYVEGHNRSKILPGTLDDILDEENVIERAEHPTTLVRPLQSIPIHHGFCCLVPDCGYATRLKNTALTDHVYKIHKGHGEKVLEHCNVQCVYRSPVEYWAVEPNYSSFAGGKEHLIPLLEEIKKADCDGLCTGVIEVPQDVRHVTPFLSTFKWAKIVEGKEAAELIELVTIKKKEDRWASLCGGSSDYFAALEDVMDGFNPIALQWINSPKG